MFAYRDKARAHATLCDTLRKIDFYMSRHPIWSRTMPRVQIETTQRNYDPNARASKQTWVTGPGIDQWCVDEKLTDDGSAIEQQCLNVLQEICDSLDFKQVLRNGLNVVERIDVRTRRNIENMYERMYHDACRKTGKLVDACDIESTMRIYLAKTAYLPHEIDDIVDYCKYRHVEFSRTFFVSNSEVTLTIFAYVLPRKCKIDECAYHKASVMITNENFYRKYATCRWRKLIE